MILIGIDFLAEKWYKEMWRKVQTKLKWYWLALIGCVVGKSVTKTTLVKKSVTKWSTLKWRIFQNAQNASLFRQFTSINVVYKIFFQGEWNPSKIMNSRIDGYNLIQTNGVGFGCIELDLSTTNTPANDLTWSIQIIRT